LGRYFRERADLTYVDTEKLGLPCKRMLIAHAPLT
jgi:hypothetical protein